MTSTILVTLLFFIAGIGGTASGSRAGLEPRSAVTPPLSKTVDFTTTTSNGQDATARDFRRLAVGTSIAVVSSFRAKEQVYEVLRSTQEGAHMASLSVSTDEILDLLYDHDLLYILTAPAPDKSTSYTHLYSAAQDMSSVRPLLDQLPLATYRLVQLDSGLYSVSRDGLITHIRPGNSGTVFPPLRVRIDHPDATLFEGLSGDTIAVIDQISASITAINMSTGNVVPWMAEVPEIGTIRDKYNRERTSSKANGRTIIASAATGGQLYVMLSGFRPEEGAPILQFNDAGQVIQKLRIPMGKGTSAHVPEDMAIKEGTLWSCPQK